MRRMTVREYAVERGISETAVRKQIKQNKLRTASEIINNRKTLLVIVDDGFEPGLEYYEPSKPKPNQTGFEPFEDAEIVSNSTGLQLVSMEQSSFDCLIQNFKEMAELSVKAEKDSYERIERDYFELKTKVANLEEENKKLIYDLAISQAEVKIKEIRIKELEEKFEKIIIEKDTLWVKTKKLFMSDL